MDGRTSWGSRVAGCGGTDHNPSTREVEAENPLP
jgi:hypothetical protein